MTISCFHACVMCVWILVSHHRPRRKQRFCASSLKMEAVCVPETLVSWYTSITQNTNIDIFTEVRISNVTGGPAEEKRFRSTNKLTNCLLHLLIRHITCPSSLWSAWTAVHWSFACLSIPVYNFCKLEIINALSAVKSTLQGRQLTDTIKHQAFKLEAQEHRKEKSRS
jgi:hypothetical protein